MKRETRVRAMMSAIGDRLLRAGDPWIGRRVRAWLGEQADQGRLSIEDGALRVDGARIPIGDVALEDVRVVILGVLDVLRGLPVRLRVEHARLVGADVPSIAVDAALTITRAGWRVDDAVVTSGDARVVVNAKGTFGDAPAVRVDAKIERIGATHLNPVLARFADAIGALRVPDDGFVSGDVEWSPDRGADASLVFTTASSRLGVDLDVDARGVVGDVRVSGHVAAVDAIASGALPPAARARAEALPGLRASGDAVVTPSKAVRATLDVATTSSALAVTLAFADGALAGTKLAGTLSFADAFACGLFPGAVRPRRVGAMEIDADVDGALAAPSFVGIVSSPTLRLRLGDDATLPTIVFHDVALHLSVDARRIAWRDLEARVFAGKIASTGEFVFDGAALTTTLAIEGLRLEAVPSDANGTTPLADQLRGALHADLRVAHSPRDAFTVLGRVRVDEPDFLFLTAAGEKLARYGLPAPATRGAGPIEADVGVRDRVVRAAPIAARLEGIDVDGEFEVGFDGALRGELRAHLMQGYLRRSILLAVPAALAESVVVPVRIGGTVREPAVSADFVHTLDDLIQHNPIGSAVAGVMDGVWSALGGPRTSRTRTSRPPPVPIADPVDAVIDRILAGDPESDQLIDALAEAGIDSDEIERRIALRRAR